MKALSFTYTKKDGSKSERVLSVSVSPNKFYAGTDISELTEEEQGQYLVRLGKLKDDYLAKIAELNNDFDVNYRYRQFDPALMVIHTSEQYANNEYIKGN